MLKSDSFAQSGVPIGGGVVSVGETAVLVGVALLMVVAVGGTAVSVAAKVGVGTSVLVSGALMGLVGVLAISASRETVSSKLPPQAIKSNVMASKRRVESLFMKTL